MIIPLVFFNLMIETAKENGLNLYRFMKWGLETAVFLEPSECKELLPRHCDLELVNWHDYNGIRS